MIIKCIQEYNVGEISEYASDLYRIGRFDNVLIEYRSECHEEKTDYFYHYLKFIIM